MRYARGDVWKLKLCGAGPSAASRGLARGSAMPGRGSRARAAGRRNVPFLSPNVPECLRMSTNEDISGPLRVSHGAATGGARRPRAGCRADGVPSMPTSCVGAQGRAVAVRARDSGRGAPAAVGARAKAKKSQGAAWLSEGSPWLSLAFTAGKSQGKPIKAKESQASRKCGNVGVAVRRSGTSDRSETSEDVGGLSGRGKAGRRKRAVTGRHGRCAGAIRRATCRWPRGQRRPGAGAIEGTKNTCSRKS